MAHGTRGWTVAFVLTVGAFGCTTPAKRTPPTDSVKPLAVTPPRPETQPTTTPLSALPVAGKNGSMNVPATPTSGGTLRPIPAASPPIDSPVLPTVPATPAPKTDPGLALPPAPSGMIVDPKNISPPTPPKLDLPSLPN